MSITTPTLTSHLRIDKSDRYDIIKMLMPTVHPPKTGSKFTVEVVEVGYGLL